MWFAISKSLKASGWLIRWVGHGTWQYSANNNNNNNYYYYFYYYYYYFYYYYFYYIPTYLPTYLLNSFRLSSSPMVENILMLPKSNSARSCPNCHTFKFGSLCSRMFTLSSAWSWRWNTWWWPRWTAIKTARHSWRTFPGRPTPTSSSWRPKNQLWGINSSIHSYSDEFPFALFAPWVWPEQRILWNYDGKLPHVPAYSSSKGVASG